MKRTQIPDRKQTELSLFCSLSDAILIGPTVHLSNCVNVNDAYFIKKLCCGQLLTRLALRTKHDDRDTLVHRNLLYKFRVRR